jgi:hypothetical protein
MTVLKMYDGEKYIPCYTAPKGTTTQVGDVQLTNERSVNESKAATPKAVQAGLSPLEFKFSGATSDKKTGYFTKESLDDGVVNGWTYNGTIPLANIPQLTLDKIPQSAQERLYVATDKDAMYKLTTNNVQAGDTVKDNNTGLLYYVKKDPDGKITSSNFTDYYETYTAGKATEADHATKATNDGDGNNIVSTYATKSSIGNATITVKQNNNQVITQDNKKVDSFTVNQSKNVKINLTDTTYGDATQSTHGLMTASDKKKLDGIASNANNYTLPTASNTILGGIKVGSNLTIDKGVLSGTPDTNTTYILKKENSSIKLIDSDNNIISTIPDSNTTYDTATSKESGLMSSTDKGALDFIKHGYYARSSWVGDKGDASPTEVSSGGNFLCSLHCLPGGQYLVIGSATLADMKNPPGPGGGFNVGLSYYPDKQKSKITGISSALSPLTTDSNQKYNGYASACAVGWVNLPENGHIVLSGQTGTNTAGTSFTGYIRNKMPFDIFIGEDDNGGDGESHSLHGAGAYLIAIPIL